MLKIKKLIKECHQIAIDSGFYPEDEERNTGELLMLIVSELSEGLEAHRNNRFCKFKGVYFNLSLEKITTDMDIKKDHVYVLAIDAFEKVVKDTFEDEIADVFIRLFDLCGYLAEPEEYSWIIKRYKKHDRESCFEVENVGEWMFDFISFDLQRIMYDFKTGCKFIPSCGNAFAVLEEFCKDHKIDIEKHIAAKMAYNKTRPHKHGKEY